MKYGVGPDVVLFVFVQNNLSEQNDNCCNNQGEQFAILHAQIELQDSTIISLETTKIAVIYTDSKIILDAQ